MRRTSLGWLRASRPITQNTAGASYAASRDSTLGGYAGFGPPAKGSVRAAPLPFGTCSPAKVRGDSTRAPVTARVCAGGTGAAEGCALSVTTAGPSAPPTGTGAEGRGSTYPTGAIRVAQ